ncbi:MAG: hypothetical protein JSR80_04340 [Verrucomicrobia bacterium]|nr:hypothetical protein [Verrucomicrobiota bacterium]
MALLMMLMAAGLVSVANFFMRRSIDAGGSTRAYLVVQLFFSFAISIFLSPVRTGEYGWSASSAIVGVIAGLFLGTMLLTLGRSLERGPPGLTFAALNSATVMPALVMFLIFGSLYGYPYAPWNGIGSGLVVAGLFWAGWQVDSRYDKLHWVVFIFTAFCCHVGLLAVLQWRALMLKIGLPASSLLPFDLTLETGQWFNPVLFFVATLIQLISYWRKERRWPKGAEVLYGLFGGLGNAGGTFFLVTAPTLATPWENAMLFPLFAVSIILICNVWGQILYKEKVNWLANALCVIGLLVGTIDWKALWFWV